MKATGFENYGLALGNLALKISAVCTVTVVSPDPVVVVGGFVDVPVPGGSVAAVATGGTVPGVPAGVADPGVVEATRVESGLSDSAGIDATGLTVDGAVAEFTGSGSAAGERSGVAVAPPVGVTVVSTTLPGTPGRLPIPGAGEPVGPIGRKGSA